MKQSEAWVLQAQSDFTAAERVFVHGDDTTYCQAIAKYQQAVEKSIKAMVAAINDLGGARLPISGMHTLQHEINILDGVRRKKRDINRASVEVIDRIIQKSGSIIGLCGLAPKLPHAGMVYPRNTEYPFNDTSVDGWTAPAAPGVFTLADVHGARELTWPLHRNAAKFTSSLRRRR